MMNKRVYALALAAFLSVPAMSHVNTYSNQRKEADAKIAETEDVKETDAVESAINAEKTSVISANQETDNASSIVDIQAGSIENSEEDSMVEIAPRESVQTMEPASTVGTIAVSNVSDYVNIRSIPSTDGEILGRVYDRQVATILEVAGDWYRVESNSVEGYVKAEFFVTGAEAEALAAEIAAQPASIFDTIAVSRVSDYVNVRSMPSTDGEIVGKIYDGCAATILEVVDDWYRIESGSVKGYIKAEFFVTGAEAEALAAELATTFGVVNTTTLRVRAEASLESDCIDMVAGGSEFVVEEEKDGLGKIELDNATKGWVSLDYLDLRVEFDTAISIEEERAKLEEQRLAEERAAEARRRANAAASAANNSASSTPSSSSQPAQSAASISEVSSTLREAITTYALQFVGNPYVYGGNSLTNGTDCSGFVKLIYAEFGYNLERRASYQYKYNGTQISVDQLRPGDLVFYGSGEVEHVAMYIGNGQIVHASTSRTGIITANLYYRTPYGAVRIIND